MALSSNVKVNPTDARALSCGAAGTRGCRSVGRTVCAAPLGRDLSIT
jgi:hypothetical protein